MADNNFRNYRSRDAGYDDAPSTDRLRDPLAELARLIGQGVEGPQNGPANEFERSSRREPVLPVDEIEPAAPAQEWSDDQGYAAQDDFAQNQYTDENYIQPRLAEPHPQPRDDARYIGDNEQLADDRYLAPAEPYDDPHGYEPAVETGYREEAPPPPQSAGRRLPALPPQDDAEQYDDEDWQDDNADRQYADEEYDDDDADARPRRSAVVLIMAVLGLVIVGAASAFAYRAMFGGTILPTLPPIIKASDGPNKIAPPPGGGGSLASVPDTGGGEKLVPREEQPVQVQPTNPPPRVISTIPVSPSSGGSASAAPMPPSGGSVFPPPPPMQAAPAQPAPTSAATPEPKKVHTVLIKPQPPQQTGAGAPMAVVPQPAATTQPKPVAPVATRPAPAPVARSSGNAPLAIVPTAEGAAEPVAPRRTQVTRAEPPPRSLAPAAAPAAAPAGGGGYAVQLTSQRSEGEAKAAYQAIAAKFPKELGSRAPIIRRADLGDKGTYYRAMVGPFASSEAAAAMCSNLKAAGGSCLVQRE